MAIHTGNDAYRFGHSILGWIHTRLHIRKPRLVMSAPEWWNVPLDEWLAQNGINAELDETLKTDCRRRSANVQS
jgi:hypothetical protein